VKTDDIFVLLLIAMCVAAIVAMAVHSRRQQPTGEAGNRLEDADAAGSPDPRAIPAQGNEPVSRRRRNRRE
jgi:hypothetical protein